MNDKTISQIKFDFINPTKKENPNGSFAPACRGANQLIIYTKDNPYKTNKNYSGVNPYGFEAAINEKGIVIALNDRVKHPKNGYILSGHGSSHRFLQTNLLLGSEVSINYETKEVLIKTNKYKCLFIEFKTRKRNIVSKYKKAIKEGYEIDKKQIGLLLNEINIIQKQIKLLLTKTIFSKTQFQKLIKKSNAIFDKIYLLSSKSHRITSRNAWHRPCEKTLKEIIKTLNLCKSININGLYLESYFNGDIPGISSITDTNEEVKGCYYGPLYKNDYLLAFISEAHKRNIEVHAWVECYFVGEQSKHWKKSYKDSWHMVNYDGSVVQGNNPEGNEKDFVFLDPANPECMQYVLSIYKELLTKYDFDGINVDYIRYPHGNMNLLYSNGYSDYAMNEFKTIYNLKGDVRELVKDEINNKKWIEYRCNKITLLMENVRKLVNEVKPTCLLSTAVCSEIDYAIKNKMQDWKVWAKKGWLDLTFPMAYYEGCSEVANATNELCAFNKENAFSYTGIMCMASHLPPTLVVEQINTLFENNADGYNLFSLWDVFKRKDVRKALKLSVNRNKCVHPHSDINVLLKTFALDLNKRKEYIKDDKEIFFAISFIKKIINKDLSLTIILNKLKDLKKSITNKVVKYEINRLIRFCKVNNNVITRK